MTTVVSHKKNSENFWGLQKFGVISLKEPF